MTYEEYGIDVKNRASGSVYTTCPKCSPDRRKKSDKCLNVNLDKGVFRCNHCGWAGGVSSREAKPEKRTYTPPPEPKTKLTDKMVAWFATRSITATALNQLNVTSGEQFFPQVNEKRTCLMFNYYRDGKIVNTKYRDGDKNFRMHKGAELILYNIDSLKGQSKAYLVEGEIDALSLHICGLTNVVSVPNGATKEKNNLAYIDNSWEDIKHIQEWVICTDNDLAGRNLREELSIRLGKENCSYVVFGENKDANDCLMNRGVQAVVEHCTKPTQYRMTGVFSFEDIEDEILDFYYNGLPKGAKTSIAPLDEHLSYHEGYITVLTGIPSHGKTSFLDFLCARLNIIDGWKGGFYSPENKPLKLHASKLARIYTGKHWDGEYKMNLEELNDFTEYIRDEFWFVKPEEEYSVKSILSSVSQLVKRKGVKFFVIDAWNKLDHNDDSTSYVGKTLDEIAAFCEMNQVHCFLVVHPKKMQKNRDTGLYELPTLYDCSGSANFYNKADGGISVYRNFTEDISEIYFQKIKFEHWGKVGAVPMKYERISGRYYPSGSEPNRQNWIYNHPTEILVENPVASFSSSEDFPF